MGDRDLKLSVNVILDLEYRLLIHLLTVSVEQLDAVVIVRIVGSGDHDTAVEIIHSCNVSNRRRRCNMHDVSIRAGSHQARAKRVLKHVAGSSRILADHDLCLLAFSGAVVPAEEASDLDRMLKGQVFISFSAEAVCTEIFTHSLSLLLVDDFPAVLPDAVFRNNASHTGGGVHITVTADDRPGIADRIAAYFHVIAQHSAEFLDACLHRFRSVVNDDKLLIRLHITCNAAGAHVAVIAEDTVANIIVMGRLHMIKEDHVLKFHGITNHAVRADKG